MVNVPNCAASRGDPSPQSTVPLYPVTSSVPLKLVKETSGMGVPTGASSTVGPPMLKGTGGVTVTRSGVPGDPVIGIGVATTSVAMSKRGSSTSTTALRRAGRREPRDRESSSIEPNNDIGCSRLRPTRSAGSARVTSERKSTTRTTAG